MKKILVLFLLTLQLSFGQSIHPNLLMTKKAVAEIKKDFDKYPLFNESFAKAKKAIDEALTKPMDIPFPKDAGGGYTHEKHKQNYNEMYIAGIMYQVTGDIKYAQFIRDMLNQYAQLYPTLGKHPQGKIEMTGKLFWQTLNETVWLIHTIQAYDCIYDWLKPEERKLYEDNIFVPMCDYFLTECEEEFDRIHNHGTWMVTAVGMTGLVLDKKDFIEKSLHGSKLDNEGGFIPQLDKLFSPDGYYTEGGYYARYALWPFFIYAESLENNRPDLNIFKHRDSILKKAFYSALQMTYTNGAFMPINDALKEKTWLSQELVLASNVVFERYGHDLELLNLVKEQNQVSLTSAGLETAAALKEAKTIPPFSWKSVSFVDGADGKKGGIGILRWGSNEDMETLLFKYSSHGLSHGHFDKLHFLFYDQGEEIIQDYGAARFLNVVQKFGGRYLPENESYALHTVAHNTLVVDERSNFDFNRSESEKNPPSEYFYNADNPGFQYMSAKDFNSYPGVEMHRTMALVNDEKLDRPLVLDIFRIASKEEHQYDLPFYYMGHLVDANFDYKAYVNEKTTMGSKNGYQHLWKDAEGKSNNSAIITWLNKHRFYSIITNADSSMNIYFTQIGANDPNFNLRNDKGIMLRKKAKDFVFASIIQPHGEFDPTLEFTKNSYPDFENIKVLFNDYNFTAIDIEGKNGIKWMVLISNSDNKIDSKHTLKIGDKDFRWTGPITIIK